MAVFPGALPAAGTADPAVTLVAAGHTALHNTLADEARALGTKIGTGASTPASGKVLAGNGTGTSAWSQVDLTTMVSGVLPTQNGGTGQNSLTALPLVSPTISGVVGGSASYSTPTLTQPTIADFTGATHTHANAAGGGSLNGANAITDGTLSFAELAATIFSGQVNTYTNTGSGGGTGYYINLGGIKLCWGNTGSITTANGNTACTISMPVGFFSTIQTADVWVSNVVTLGNQYAAGGGQTPSTLSFFAVATGAASANFGWFVIGT